MNILDGIMNFLQFINDNWTVIIVIVALIISIYKKIKSLFDKSNNNKVNIAKKQIHETILKLVTDAECDYDNWVKAGDIKHSQVFREIFEKYPILSKVVNQDEIVEWINNEIVSALETLKGIIEENKETV